MNESAKSQRKSHLIDRYVGIRLRQLRRLKGVSQKELADLLSVTYQQVQHYEKGSRQISCSSIYRIACEYKVPIAFFFEGYEVNASPFKAKDTLRLVHFYNRLSSDQLKKAFLNLLKATITAGGST